MTELPSAAPTTPIRVCMACGSMSVDTPSDGCTHFRFVEFREIRPATSMMLTDIVTARRILETGLRCLHDAAHLGRLSGEARILEWDDVLGSENNVVSLASKRQQRQPTTATRKPVDASAPAPTSNATPSSTKRQQPTFTLNPEPPRRRRAK